jgi:hypothetical protein
VTVQTLVPEHAPDQPANTEPAAANAVRFTLCPKVKTCEQTVPQLIPAGLDPTVPEPAPDVRTVSVSGSRENVATADLAWVMPTVHTPVPEHAPDQPAKPEPVAAVAVNVTVVP